MRSGSEAQNSTPLPKDAAAAKGAAETPDAVAAQGATVAQSTKPKKNRFDWFLDHPVRSVVCTVLLVSLCVLIIVRFEGFCNGLGEIWSAIVPLLIGAIFAYLLNLVMVFWESIWFPHSQNKIVNRMRRVVCAILAVVSVTAVIAIIITIIVFEFRGAASAIASGLSDTIALVTSALSGIPELSGVISGDPNTWQEIGSAVMGYFGGSGSSALSSVLKTTGTVAHGVIDVLLALIFALYLLVDKDRVKRAAMRLVSLLPKQTTQDTVTHVAKVTNDCFSRFICGQCIEATILGSLCGIGCWILGFPYAAPIGLVVGVTSLVPFIGAWVGGAVGALMIFSSDPVQAVIFIVFLVILQQIEGHLIYPNVVGKTVGLPGIWVFVAVVVGGALFGVVGILLGVPTISSIRTLVVEYFEKRDAQQTLVQ